MKLSECRKQKGETVAQAARKVGVKDHTWRYWERGIKRPHSERTYRRIFLWSGGLITPNSFYKLPYEKLKAHNRR